jgi:hypothetical protein
MTRRKMLSASALVLIGSAVGAQRRSTPSVEVYKNPT